MIKNLTYRNNIAKSILAVFRYGMLGKIIFAQYSF
jgi:hypothetical protein